MQKRQTKGSTTTGYADSKSVEMKARSIGAAGGEGNRNCKDDQLQARAALQAKILEVLSQMRFMANEELRGTFQLLVKKIAWVSR